MIISSKATRYDLRSQMKPYLQPISFISATKTHFQHTYLPNAAPSRSSLTFHSSNFKRSTSTVKIESTHVPSNILSGSLSPHILHLTFASLPSRLITGCAESLLTRSVLAHSEKLSHGRRPAILLSVAYLALCSTVHLLLSTANRSP